MSQDSSITINYNPDDIRPLLENKLKVADAIITTDIPEGIIVINPITYALLNNKGWDL